MKKSTMAMLALGGLALLAVSGGLKGLGELGMTKAERDAKHAARLKKKAERRAAMLARRAAIQAQQPQAQHTNRGLHLGWRNRPVK